jgi:hypothetical protein
MKNELSRNEKIKLLKGILKGGKSLNDLIPPKVRIFTKRDENDFYRESETGKEFYVTGKNDLQSLFPRDTITLILIKRTILKSTHF